MGNKVVRAHLCAVVAKVLPHLVAKGGCKSYPTLRWFNRKPIRKRPLNAMMSFFPNDALNVSLIQLILSLGLITYTVCNLNYRNITVNCMFLEII